MKKNKQLEYCLEASTFIAIIQRTTWSLFSLIMIYVDHHYQEFPYIYTSLSVTT